VTDAPRPSLGAVLPVLVDSAEQAHNLEVVAAALARAGVDEIWVVEQRCGAAAPGAALPSGVRHEVVDVRREALCRGRLVNCAIARMDSDWVWVCDPNVVMPFGEIAPQIVASPHVAVQVAGEIESLGDRATAALLRGGEAAAPPGAVRAAPFGKASYAVRRDVLLACGGLSEAFVGAADEGFELVRRLKRFFDDFGSLGARGLELWAPRRTIDRAARADNKRLAERLAGAIEADPDGYLAQRLETSLVPDLPALGALSRRWARRAAFRVREPTPPPRIPRPLPGSIWGITALFNPRGYRSKRDNFDLFRDRLRRQGLPLLAVELAFGDAPHELGLADADRVVLLRAESVLWQKERLLNVGVSELPADCDKVVWLDADILFERDDWVARTAELLEEVVVVQPFSRSVRLLAGARSAPLDDLPIGSGDHEELHGMAWGVEAKGYGCLGRYLEHGHSGYAWAARRDVLARHGLYDANVLGNADLNMAHAMFGGARSLRTERLSPLARAHLARWADALHADVRGSVGHVEGRVLHLWHGHKEDRRYLDRLDLLAEHAFDPERDLAIEGGAWRWASDKPALHAALRDYFARRSEDG
jgi:hypothetical protein